MNIPNSLTIIRILLVPFIILFLLIKDFTFNFISFILFCIAAITDIFDGEIARKYKKITNFGVFLDPIADKILVLSILLIFVILKIIPLWIFIIIAVREVLVTSVRGYYLTKGKVIPAKSFGKHKAIWQMSAIFIIFLFFIFKDKVLLLGNWIVHIPYCIILLVMFISVISGVDFFIRLKYEKT
jgi:CDP-diacylglycerol--glycerol-3-phosphate 3-phosphatidyltransferase